MDRANQALGRLDGVSLLLPDPNTLLYSFVRKEAVLSSQIEGTQSSLSDLLLFEQDVVPGVPESDVKETANYIAALNHGLERMATGFPLSLRLIREMHERLLASGRGQGLDPGEFRRSQNWIGGSRPGAARFVPPPADEVTTAMGALELFLHDAPGPTPILLKAGLAHAQFETIHPFLDGNGRVGRLLVTLLLCSENVLTHPLLYMSLYLKQHRDAYYDHLQAVRTDGAWEEWLRFFLTGVDEVARSATTAIQRIVKMVAADREAVAGLGRAAGAALAVYEVCVRQVVVTAPGLIRQTTLSGPTIYAALSNLESLGILKEMTGRPRDRAYAHGPYLAILNEDSL
jgi:Fic family protein